MSFWFIVFHVKLRPVSDLFWVCRCWTALMLCLTLGAFMIQVVIAMIITRKGLVRFLGTGSLPSSAVPALCTRWVIGIGIDFAILNL